MAEEKEERVKIMTLDEANRAIPAVDANLKSLRALEREILSKQAQVDIEEMVGACRDGTLTAAGTRTRDEKLAEYNDLVRRFYAKFDEIEALGGVLKDLKKGLVDFYAMRDGELVFLCWEEGEKNIAYWHSLENGYAGRQPL